MQIRSENDVIAPLPECYVCMDSGISASLPCPRCRPKERKDQKDARNEAETARRASLNPRRYLAHVEEHSEAVNTYRLVLFAIASRADAYGWASMPIFRLAEVCRISEATARRCLKHLIATGDINLVKAGRSKSLHPEWRIQTTPMDRK